jgi:hypothetical protein
MANITSRGHDDLHAGVGSATPTFGKQATASTGQQHHKHNQPFHKAHLSFPNFLVLSFVAKCEKPARPVKALAGFHKVVLRFGSAAKRRGHTGKCRIKRPICLSELHSRIVSRAF